MAVMLCKTGTGLSTKKTISRLGGGGFHRLFMACIPHDAHEYNWICCCVCN